MLIDDYINYQNTYKAKYGKNTIVLYQNGSFFELYNVDPNNNEVQKICELLNITYTRKNKAIIEVNRSNPALGGIPTHALKKYLNVLINNDYTVVLVEQITEPPNPERGVTNIYSPSTYIENLNEPYSNIIVSLYISQEQCFKSFKKIFVYSLCNIDISTGNCSVYQSNNYIYDKNEMFNDIYRYIEANNCKELIINTNNIDDFTFDDLYRNIDSRNRIIHFDINNMNKIENKYFNMVYQNDFLKKVYPDTGFLTPIEYLNLEKYPEIVCAFIILLNFCYDHNENIIKKIKVPTFYEYNDHLILYNNSVYQLDIIECNKYKDNELQYKSLFNIINKCCTNLGKRLLQYRILNPITNIKKITERYNQIEYLLKSDQMDEFSYILKNIVDIERFHRKLFLKMLQPHEFFTLTYSYKNIIKIFDLVKSDYSLFGIDTTLIDTFNKYIQYYESLFNLCELSKCGLNNITSSFFNNGIYKEIDNIQAEIDLIKKYFNDETTHLSNVIEMGSDFVKLDSNERDGYFFYTTKNRSDLLLKKLSNDEKKLYEVRKFNGTNVKIVTKELVEKSNKLLDLEMNIQKLIRDEYMNVLTYITENYKDLFNNISHFIAVVDISYCGAKCSLMYKYVRPKIDDRYNGESYFIAREIRHPIIEVINEEFDYVKNDIELLKGDDEKSSMLLYGLNSAGKSSLIKAVCLNIVLSQMGFYCASSDFTYYPYNKMFVRISSDDNLFKGMSSYAVEINELRSILNYADSRSILAIDELCKGTESVSAISLCASALLYFSKKNINYINTTHLHELYEIEEIKNLKNLAIKHIKVDYNEKDDNIIYIRKLEEGIPPNKYYGLEFASYLIKNSDFIVCANSIRNKLLNKHNEILPDKTSQYNSNLFMESCIICGDTGITYPLDCHHIKYQKFFDEHDINRNKLSNLVVLCKKHHDQLHNNELVINGYKDTIKGKILDYSKNKKYTMEDCNLIKELSKKFKNINHLILELKNNNNITISPKTLKKILDDCY